ncbi:MAG TPA: endonuclease/exonuclease/phosphatase family protein, partial [Tabrizicola sp.]
MAPDSKPSLRVASWNIHKAVGTDRRRDAERVLAAIAALDADILALQEADRRLGDRPSTLPRDRIAALTGLEPLPIGRNAVSLGWHGNALLARPGIHLAAVEHLDLPGHEPRGAVIADLDTPTPLRVVAVHLGLLRAARRQQLDAIKAALGRHPARPTVILGDFNEHSRRVGLGRIATPFVILPTAATFPARKPFLPLDRIVHSP